MVLAAISSFPRSRPLPCPALSWTVIYTAFFVLYFVFNKVKFIRIFTLFSTGLAVFSWDRTRTGLLMRLHHAAGWAIPLVNETWFTLSVFTPEASLI